MHIDLFMIVFLSTPEAVLYLPMMLLLGQQKARLKLNKPNAFRFVATVALMLAVSWFIRPLASSPAVSTAYHAIAYILILIIVYRMSFGTAFLSVSMAIQFLYMTENTIVLFAVTHISKSAIAFLGSSITMLMFSIPIRILQGLAAYFLSKYYEVFEISKVSKKLGILFATCNLGSAVIGFFFSHIYTQIFNTLSFTNQIIFALGLLLLFFLQLTLIFAFMYMTVKDVMWGEYHRYRGQRMKSKMELQEMNDNIEYAFNEIHSILKKDRDIDKVVSILEDFLDIKHNNQKDGDGISISGGDKE